MKEELEESWQGVVSCDRRPGYKKKKMPDQNTREELPHPCIKKKEWIYIDFASAKHCTQCFPSKIELELESRMQKDVRS